MGNCFKTASSSMEWDGEDWGSLTSKHNSKGRMSSSKVFDEMHESSSGDDAEREKVIGMLRASSDCDGKVKIKISKKELKKLLRSDQNKKQADQHGDGHHGSSHASAEQVLVGLITARDHDHVHHHRHWKPVLQSIPEVN